MSISRLVDYITSEAINDDVVCSFVFGNICSFSDVGLLTDEHSFLLAKAIKFAKEHGLNKSGKFDQLQRLFDRSFNLPVGWSYSKTFQKLSRLEETGLMLDVEAISVLSKSIQKEIQQSNELMDLKFCYEKTLPMLSLCLINNPQPVVKKLAEEYRKIILMLVNRIVVNKRGEIC